MIAFPEHVTDALALRGDRPDRAAADLVQAFDLPTALSLALGVLVEQRREIASLAEEAEEARRDHERLFGKVERWREKNADADPEESLAAILDDNLPSAW